MHTCNCSLTTVVNLNIIDRFFPENNNPRQVTIQVEYGGTADYTTADIRDSMSIACGDGLGYTYCGNRQLQFINMTSGITLQDPSQGLLESNFQVTVVHPCRNTTMDNVTITDDLLFKFTNQTKEVIKINVGVPNDTMSWFYGN